MYNHLRNYSSRTSFLNESPFLQKNYFHNTNELPTWKNLDCNHIQYRHWTPSIFSDNHYKDQLNHYMHTNIECKIKHFKNE